MSFARSIVNIILRLDYQPLFGKGARWKLFFSGRNPGEERRPDTREKQKSSLHNPTRMNGQNQFNESHLPSVIDVYQNSKDNTGHSISQEINSNILPLVHRSGEKTITVDLTIYLSGWWSGEKKIQSLSQVGHSMQETVKVWDNRVILTLYDQACFLQWCLLCPCQSSEKSPLSPKQFLEEGKKTPQFEQT